MNDEQRQLQNERVWKSILMFYKSTLPRLEGKEMGTYERNGIIHSNLGWAQAQLSIYANPVGDNEKLIVEWLHKMVYQLRSFYPLGGL